MTGWAFGFVQGEIQTEGVLLSDVDQILSTICESSRTKVMSSLWDQLTKGSSRPNKKMANSMLSIHLTFFADMAEDSSRGAHMVPCHPLPCERPGDQHKTCIYSLILEYVQDLLLSKNDFLTNKCCASSCEGCLQNTPSLYVTVLMTFQLREYLAFTKCRKVERMEINRQDFFANPFAVFLSIINSGSSMS